MATGNERDAKTEAEDQLVETRHVRVRATFFAYPGGARSLKKIEHRVGKIDPRVAGERVSR